MPLDIVLQILETLKSNKPDSTFIVSLHQQYCNLGGLSKKQLEGLHAKAKQSGLIAETQLATLEAIIKKKPTRFRSEKIEKAPSFEKDAEAKPLLWALLEKYPQHKMAVFLQNKVNSNQPLTDTEIGEVKRLHKLLIK
jgi:hypothetical protein